MSCNSSPDMSMILPADVARLCQQWHLDAKVPQASKSSSAFADVMPVSQPGVLLALYYGLSFLCMLQLLLQWWLRDRLDRVNGLDIWRIREASGSSQHRYILLSSSCRISRMCLYIVGIGELVNFSRCQPFMQQDNGQIKKQMYCTGTTHIAHFVHKYFVNLLKNGFRPPGIPWTIFVHSCQPSWWVPFSASAMSSCW